MASFPIVGLLATIKLVQWKLNRQWRTTLKEVDWISIPLFFINLSQAKKHISIIILRIINAQMGIGVRWSLDSSVLPLPQRRVAQLTRFQANRTKFKDLSMLEGMPLAYLEFPLTQINDLTPLKNMKLTDLVFTPQKITNGIEVVREMKTLRRISDSSNEPLPPASEFWKKYDAGEFNK